MNFMPEVKSVSFTGNLLNLTADLGQQCGTREQARCCKCLSLSVQVPLISMDHEYGTIIGSYDINSRPKSKHV
jgi:hypothetical protein